MTVGSLFSGMCGFELGFARAGFDTLWSVEIDSNCQKVIKARFPNSVIHTDVTTFDPDLHRCPEIVTFGFPCQSLSVAGQRRGLSETHRSGLFYEATRIISRLVPRGLHFALAENVPGLFSSDGGRDFARVLGTLGQCGAMDIGWAVLDCRWWRLAQRRKRVFVVADFRGRRAAEILSLSESLCGNPAPSRQTGQRTAPTLESRAGRSGANNFATSGGLAATLTKQYASHHGRTAGNNGGVAENHLIPTVSPPIGGVSNHGGANGPGRTVDDCESLVPVTSNPIAGHHHRHDLDNETYVLAHGQANAEVVSDGSPSLTSNHEAPICIQEVGKRQSGTPQNGTGISEPGDPMYTLQSTAQHAIAFSSKDSGQDAGELSPTLRSMNYDQSHINGGGQVAIAFRAAGQDGFTPSEQTPPIAATDGGGAGAPTVAFTERTRADGRNFETQEELAYALTNPGSGGRTHSRSIATKMQVRRLTPTECLRLMGYPDDYFDGLNFSDSVKYRLIGNSVAIPVVEWIAHRLKQSLAKTPKT